MQDITESEREREREFNWINNDKKCLPTFYTVYMTNYNSIGSKKMRYVDMYVSNF
jgi:hypothetical protein